MQEYHNLHTKEIFNKVRQGNAGSIVTTTSATVSAVLLPIIITLINKISETNNTTLIIALSIICVTTIISTIIGGVIMNVNKGASNALKKDLDDIANLINENFEVKNDEVCPIHTADIKTISQKIPKKLVNIKSTQE